MELAAPTEREVVRLFGVPPSDLSASHLRKTEIKGEKGQNLTVWPMRLDGMTPEEQGAKSPC